MKLKQLLTKTLLVAAGLSAGTSAWGQTYTYEVLYGNETKTDGVTTGVTAQTDFTGDANAKTLDSDWTDPNGNNAANIPTLSGSVLSTNSTAAWTKDFASPITEGKVYFSGVYVTPHNYKNGYANNGDSYMIQILDSKGNAIFKSATHCKNGNSSDVVTICGTAVSNSVRLGSKAPHYIKSLCIDLDARTVTYDVNVSSGSKSYTNKTGTIELSEDITDVKGLYMIKSTADYSGGILDMVTLYSLQSDNPKFTVNYKVGEEIVKTVTGSDEVGTVINAADVIYAGGQKYFLDDEQTTSMTLVAGSNVLNVNVTAAANYTYSIKAVDGTGTELKVLGAGSYFEGDEAPTVSWNKCLNIDGIWYYTNATTFTKTMEGTTNETVTYIADPTIVYFEEAEIQTAGKTANSSYSGGYCSTYRNGGSKYYQSTTVSGTAVYRVDMYVAEGYTKDRSFAVYKKDGDEYTVLSIVTKPGEAGLYSRYFTADAGTTLYTGHTNNTLGLDYLIIRKLYDVTDVSKIVGAVDYSTAQDGATSSDYTLKKGDTKVLTFQNHGSAVGATSSTWGYNWRILAKEGETYKAKLRADSYDDVSAAASNITSYKVSKDGGSTKVNLDWTEYASDMMDAEVVATLAYGTDGMLTITTTSTGETTGYIYYVDHQVTGLNDDLTVNLSVNNSWIEVLSEEQTTAGVTVGANGYATFASSYPLDLTDENRPEGLKAYKATLSGTTLSFTKLNQTVPAGTGLLLLGETKDGTYNIPVVAEGTAVESNALVGVTTATPLQSTEGGVYYFVMKKATSADDALAFAPLSTASAVTVPAGKAYVAFNTGGGARSLTVCFDDDSETTGINTVHGEGLRVNGYYNLQGQRISQPTKGLYIMNGQKVMIK